MVDEYARALARAFRNAQRTIMREKGQLTFKAFDELDQEVQARHAEAMRMALELVS